MWCGIAPTGIVLSTWRLASEMTETELSTSFVTYAFPACCETVDVRRAAARGIVASTFPVAASKTVTLLSVLLVTHTVPALRQGAGGFLGRKRAAADPLTARPTVANTMVFRFMASLLLDCCESPEEV
jgi:hypothetical protein